MGNSPKYWVACSGGIDSVVLLHIMHENGEDVGILHCNFHLRGESSNQDEQFVRELAKQLHLPILVQEFDTKQYEKDNRINTELAARELRYNWFDEIIQKEDAMVLLGHHYDDQIETFFLQLRRGGKVRGLSGMPVYRKGYLRPLLKYSKKELIVIAKKNKWKWREDETNTSNEYMRNWYRNDILPWLSTSDFPLEEVVPLMHSFQELLKWMNKLPVPSDIKIEDWFLLPIWIQQHILATHQLGEFSEDEVTRLAKAQKGKFLGNDKCKVWNEGGKLVFVKEKTQVEFKLVVKTLPQEEIKMNNKDLFLDASKVKEPFNFRVWEAGDRFQPIGMKGEKLIGKFLRDRKVPTHQKEHIQVLVNEKNQILGIFGFGVDEKYKIDIKTEVVFQLQIRELRITN